MPRYLTVAKESAVASTVRRSKPATIRAGIVQVTRHERELCEAFGSKPKDDRYVVD